MNETFVSLGGVSKAVCAQLDMQPRPGTYTLLLSSATDAVIQVGRLGNLRLQPPAAHSGREEFVLASLITSAPAKRPHWHIDYLRKRTKLKGAWVCYDEKSWEHRWARRFSLMPGASMPMPLFGSSDCDCESHLFFPEGKMTKWMWGSECCLMP